MADDFEYNDADFEKIRSENTSLLTAFSTWLSESGLAPATVRKHQSNIDFYINAYLLYTDPTHPVAGMTEGDISMFMGYWFIKKAGWASQASLKSNATSLKKFGEFLYARGMLEKEELDSIKTIIKQEMPEWQATMARYDDLEIDIDDVWEI